MATLKDLQDQGIAPAGGLGHAKLEATVESMVARAEGREAPAADPEIPVVVAGEEEEDVSQIQAQPGEEEYVDPALAAKTAPQAPAAPAVPPVAPPAKEEVKDPVISAAHYQAQDLVDREKALAEREAEVSKKLALADAIMNAENDPATMLDALEGVVAKDKLVDLFMQAGLPQDRQLKRISDRAEKAEKAVADLREEMTAAQKAKVLQDVQEREEKAFVATLKGSLDKHPTLAKLPDSVLVQLGNAKANQKIQAKEPWSHASLLKELEEEVSGIGRLFLPAAGGSEVAKVEKPAPAAKTPEDASHAARVLQARRRQARNNELQPKTTNGLSVSAQRDVRFQEVLKKYTS